MSKQFFLMIFLSFFIFSCPSNEKDNSKKSDGTTTEIPDDKTTTKVIPPFNFEIPQGHKMLNEASGDLDKDGSDEKVVVLNTGNMGDMGEERVLLVFRVEDGEWKLWERAYGAILPSEHGGTMGDPFESISVERGAIVIKHFGGSRSKWDITHRFRYQNNDWKLIGATIAEGIECVRMETFDYNLTSGNVIVKAVNQSCKNGENPKTEMVIFNENFNYKMKSLPTMNGFDFENVFAVNQLSGSCYPESNCYEYDKKVRENSKKTFGGRELNSIAELQGVYGLGGHDDSWVLHIKCDSDKNDNIFCTTTYYEIDGMLPPEENLILNQGTPQVLKKFNVDFTDLTFDSDLGKGKIGVNENMNPTITFFDIESHIDDQLVLDWIYGYSVDH